MIHRRHSTDNTEFEFTGLEKQSRILKNTLKYDSATINQNPILSRIAAEKKRKEKEEKEEEEERRREGKEEGFHRKKLLVKELTKSESVNFLDSYREKDGSQNNAKHFSMFKLRKLGEGLKIKQTNKAM